MLLLPPPPPPPPPLPLFLLLILLQLRPPLLLRFPLLPGPVIMQDVWASVVPGYVDWRLLLGGDTASPPPLTAREAHKVLER